MGSRSSIFFAFTLVGLMNPAFSAFLPDWSFGALIPLSGRENPYGFTASELPAIIEKGRLDALIYPVSITGILIPYHPTEKLLALPKTDFVKQNFLKAMKLEKDVRSWDELTEWLGFHPYPMPDDYGIYAVPYPGGQRPAYRMGVTLMESHGAVGVTFACAGCHSGTLFGKTVLGLSSRFPRANEFFYKSKAAALQIPAPVLLISRVLRSHKDFLSS